MPLTPGTRFGPYEIVALLGAGGMGEVYRARDTRLGRDVAIKVLPQHLSSNPEIRARFEREAKTVSSLNHPNICVLFDVGREGETEFLVMELIEGDTLAARLARAPLPPAEALRLGTQIADALDRAHRAGVIHRDLKPGNVMITRNGAKLMDFGLSRAIGLAGTGSGSSRMSAALSQSPTIAQALTAEGTLLGTFQYMSPEQLEGREADARSDVWALGCVLYEMFTGRRAFEGRSQASLIAAILEREPAAVSETPSGASSAGAIPHGIDRLIRNCLAKDPDERIQTAHDVRLQLQGLAEGAGLAPTSVSGASAITAPAAAARRANARLPWAVAALGLVAAAGIFAWLYPQTQAPASTVRFKINEMPGVTTFFWPRISPDGRVLVMQAEDSASVQRAYARRMDQVDANPISGTEGIQRAYWSPDSREIAFIADGKLKRVPIAGGSPVIVCAAPKGSDISWGAGGHILMDSEIFDSLEVVPAGGGELRPATRIDRANGEVGTSWPCFLPDGKHFLFIGTVGDASGGNIRLGKLGSLDSKLLGTTNGRVEYGPGGWVLYVKGPALVAQKLDVGSGKLTGQPIPLVEDVRFGSSQGHFSTSSTGVFAFARQSGSTGYVLHQATRSGVLGERSLASGPIANPRVSPSGRRMLYQRSGGAVGQGAEIYVLDLDRGTDTRLTFTNETAYTPAWAPDGRQFAYALRTAGRPAILMMGSSDGLGVQDSIVLPGRSGASLTQWSASGPSLVYFSGRFHGMTVPIQGSDRTPRALTDTTQFTAHHTISPDGRWVAFAMGRSPNVEVYVQSLTGSPGRWQISTGHGFSPVWTEGGREIIFESMESQLMAVDIDDRDGFHAGTPRPLFTLPTGAISPELSSWGCDASGESFVVLVPRRAPAAGNIEVVTNFREMVTRK